MELNVTKTKEFFIDFRRARINIIDFRRARTVIMGQPVEMIVNYQYLGTIIYSKLGWSSNIEAC